jgi:hypothetical protein
MQRLYPRSVYKNQVRIISVPRPGERGRELRDVPLLDWCKDLLTTILGEPAPAAPATS